MLRIQAMHPRRGIAMSATKEFTVATFFTPGDKLSRSRIRCYTMWYNPAWTGCIEVKVEAASGKDAKLEAREWRYNHERAMA